MNEEQVEALIKAFNSIAFQLKYLGVGDAATPMGALEHLAVELKEGMESIATALDNVADAIKFAGAEE